jgi:hypothetical protein
MLDVEPWRFSAVKWVGIGDDDSGFSQELLLDYLGHYDHRDRLILNPSADSLENQRRGEGRVNVKWNSQVRRCNAVIPERLMGVVVSRGLIDAAQTEFQNETMEKLCHRFGPDAAQDTVQGLLWWMYDAKWIPMGLLSHDNEKFDMPNVPKVPQLLIAQKLTTSEDYKRFEAIRRSYFPAPEPLCGTEYRDSRNAKRGGGAWSLNGESCLPWYNQSTDFISHATQAVLTSLEMFFNIGLRFRVPVQQRLLTGRYNFTCTSKI